MLKALAAWAVRAAVMVLAFYLAYDIRMYAIREYGRLIHGAISSCMRARRSPTDDICVSQSSIRGSISTPRATSSRTD